MKNKFQDEVSKVARLEAELDEFKRLMSEQKSPSKDKIIIVDVDEPEEYKKEESYEENEKLNTRTMSLSSNLVVSNL